MSELEVRRELTDDGILIVTLNRPDQMNAVNQNIIAGLMEAALETKQNDDIRVIVITGEGRGFCAGADLSTGGPATKGNGVGGRSAMMDKLGPGRLIETLADCYVPIIGAINGAAAGAGFGIALCCDIRIASDQARLGSIFIKRGVGTDFGASYWLPKIVGLPKAYELLYSGDLLNADEALKIDLVNRVVPHESLMEETLAYARMIANGPPLGYTYTRRTVVQSFEKSLHDYLILEWTQQRELLATNDASEGFKAFLEQRDPEFKGN